MGTKVNFRMELDKKKEKQRTLKREEKIIEQLSEILNKYY
jgi:hypothetical protein